METSVISDARSSIAYSTESLGFSNFLNRPHNVLSLPDTSSDQPPKSPSFHVSAVSPPPTRTLTKRRPRKTRRIRRRMVIDYDGEENGFFVFSDGGDFNGGDGYFGGGGGGGKGGSFGGYGGANWEEFSDNSVPDPAFDFVYEVLCWIAMSNCLHFAFKKVVRLVADGFGDRGKVPMPIASSLLNGK